MAVKVAPDVTQTVPESEYGKLKKELSETRNVLMTERRSKPAESAQEVAQMKQSLSAVSQVVDSLESSEFDGQLLIDCPKKMIEKREYDIQAVVARNFNKAEILQAISSAQSVSLEETTNNSKIFNVTLSNRIRMQIAFDTEDFKLISEQKDFEKNIEQGPEWFYWKIKPLKPGKDKKLTFVLQNLKDGEWSTYKAPQTFTVEVDIDATNFVTNVWEFANDNPEWAMTTIILPLISFVAGRFIRKKKQDEA